MAGDDDLEEKEVEMAEEEELASDLPSPSLIYAMRDEGEEIPMAKKRKTGEVLPVAADNFYSEEDEVEKYYAYLESKCDAENEEFMKKVKDMNNIVDKRYEEYKALLESQGLKIDFDLEDGNSIEPYKRVNLLLETDEMRRRGLELMGFSVGCMEQDKQFLDLYKLAEENMDKFKICAPESFFDNCRTLGELANSREFNLLSPQHLHGCVNMVYRTKFYQLTMKEGRNLLDYLMNNDYKEDCRGDETGFRNLLVKEYPTISKAFRYSFTKDMIELVNAEKKLDEDSAKAWIAEHTKIHLDKDLPINEYEYVRRLVERASKLGIDKMKSRAAPGLFGYGH